MSRRNVMMRVSPEFSKWVKEQVQLHKDGFGRVSATDITKRLATKLTKKKIIEL